MPTRHSSPVTFPMDSLGIGLIGFGMIGKVHALAYREIPHFYPRTLPPIQLAAICTTRAESAERAAHEGGFDNWTTNLDELVSRADVQVVDVCLPNYAHRPTILAAIHAGKHVLVDKPLALNAAEAQEIVDAAREANVRVGMVCNYRFVPALMLAHQMIAEGALGQIYHYHIDYLHTGYQNPQRPMSWRLRHAQSGGGALVDLGSHVIDMARFLIGEFETVNATTRTYITERPADAKSEKREGVDVDDAAWLNAKMQNGAQGTLFVTRFATGAVDDMNVQVYGERGALKFSLQDGNVLQFFDATANAATQGWTRIPTGTQFQGAVVPPPRSILGWNRTHAENIYQFLRAVVENKPFAPDANDGLRVHQVIDNAYALGK
ncbi:MAG: Gfo/Idh/MocA family oxidoreductase [Chloroflexi bacterium]|nr:Gfo/Idh/MocA family oxidoreductase [Chloroflexota bacterium]